MKVLILQTPGVGKSELPTRLPGAPTANATPGPSLRAPEPGEFFLSNPIRRYGRGASRSVSRSLPKRGCKRQRPPPRTQLSMLCTSRARAKIQCARSTVTFGSPAPSATLSNKGTTSETGRPADAIGVHHAEAALPGRCIYRLVDLSDGPDPCSPVRLLQLPKLMALAAAVVRFRGRRFVERGWLRRFAGGERIRGGGRDAGGVGGRPWSTRWVVGLVGPGVAVVG